jgi:hypothetical protein
VVLSNRDTARLHIVSQHAESIIERAVKPAEHLLDKDAAKPDFENVGLCSHPCSDHSRITRVCQPPMLFLYSWLITISLSLSKWRRSAGYAGQGIAYSTTCSAWSVHICSIESFAMPTCLRLCQLNSHRSLSNSPRTSSPTSANTSALRLLI